MIGLGWSITLLRGSVGWDVPLFCLSDQFLCVAGSDSAAPADSCNEYCTGHNRPVEYLQHLKQHLSFFKKKKSALFLDVNRNANWIIF